MAALHPSAETPDRRSALNAILPSPRAFALAAVGAVTLVVLLSSTFNAAWTIWGGTALRVLYRAMWVDAEGNIATMLNFSLLLACSGFAVANAVAAFAERGRWRFHWLALSALLFLMAFDEAAQLHERLIAPVHRVLGTSGAFLFAWTIPAAAAVLVVGLLMLRFVLAQPAAVRNAIFAAAAVYLLGALGLEMVGSAIYDASSRSFDGLGYKVATTAEETFEMAGLVILGAALLASLRTEPTRARSVGDGCWRQRTGSTSRAVPSDWQ